MLDVLICGGGVAGSALAIFLGRAGLSVELFERDVFPREKPCGEGLMPAGVAVLERLGLAEVARGAPFLGVRYRFDKRCVEAAFPRVNGHAIYGRGVRRKYSDHLLFQTAAETSGVRAYTGARVGGLCWENGRVAGVTVNGELRCARLVVAADGAHSRIRRELGLDATPSGKRMGIRVHYRLASGREQSRWVDVSLRRGYELYVTPLAGGEILIAALANVRGGGEPIHKTFQRWIFVEPALADLLDGAEQISEPACASWPVSSARPRNKPGVVLLGDAAGSIDPISGGGMTHALLTAELLAGYVRNGIESGEQWMSSFERQRQTLLANFRRLTRALLWLADHPAAAAQLLAAFKKFPPLLSFFAGVAGGVSRLSGPIEAPKALRFDRACLPQMRSVSRPQTGR
jgi:flavin-dependent dehydrogenase